MFKAIYTFLILTILSLPAFSQKDQLEKVWYNQEKTSKIQVYLAKDGKYYGRITWLKTTHDENGNLRTDKNNPEKTLQNQPLNGLIILKGFSKTDNPNVYENGTVYDPNNGKTYCGKITFKGNELALRGYICSFSLLGRTSTWTLAE